MKNEYFQENKGKIIEYTREMILSDDKSCVHFIENYF